MTKKSNKSQAIYKKRRVNENNTEIIKLRIHIIDFLDFNSTISTKTRLMAIWKNRELDVKNKTDTKRKIFFILLIYLMTQMTFVTMDIRKKCPVLFSSSLSV